MEKKQNQIANNSEILYWSSLGHYVVCVALEAIILILWLLHALAFNPGVILVVLIPAYFLLSISGLLVAHSRPTRVRLFNFLLLFGSLAIVSTIIHLTGPNHNEFLFLYTIPIINATLLSTPLAVFVTITSVAIYSLVEYIEFVVNPAGQFGEVLLDEVRHIGLLLLIGVVAAFQTRYYLIRIKRSEEEIISVKDQFLFRTVHDIRAPTTDIKFISEKYQQPAIKKKYPEIAADIGTIHDQTSRILGLVKDLLGAVSDERPDLLLEFKPVDLPLLMGRILEEQKPRWKARRIKIKHTVDANLPEALADSDKLSEVFQNLIENATKYNKLAGEINISYLTTHDAVLAVVKNTTPKPIAKESLAKFFTPFFRDPPNREIQGTGLGLFICRRLVEKMHGKISANADDETVTFTVSLPKT